MWFNVDITIPASTTRTSPTTVVVPLVRGTIRRWQVAFPPGPAGLAHVTVYDRLHQVFPANVEESLAWDDITLDYEDEYELDGPPYELEVRGWNEDDSFDHTVTVRMSLEPVVQVAALEQIRGFLQQLRGGVP